MNGRGVFIIDNAMYRPTNGDIICFFPGSSIQYYDNEAYPWHYQWFTLEGFDVISVLRTMGITPQTPHHQGDFHHQLSHVIQDLKDLYTRENTDLLTAISLSWQMIVLCNNALPHSTVSKVLLPEEKLKIECDRYFFMPITLKMLFQKMSQSSVTIRKRFKDRYHMSPKKYLQQKRLDRACTLLRTTSLTIRIIAQKSGFSEHHYFMRVFKEYIKMTPTQYRQLITR